MFDLGSWRDLDGKICAVSLAAMLLDSTVRETPRKENGCIDVSRARDGHLILSKAWSEKSGG